MLNCYVIEIKSHKDETELARVCLFTVTIISQSELCQGWLVKTMQFIQINTSVQTGKSILELSQNKRNIELSQNKRNIELSQIREIYYQLNYEQFPYYKGRF